MNADLTKLLFKTGVLVSLLGFFTLLINWIDPLPYHWASDQLNTKVKFLAEKEIDPKAYFIGSSTTLRHVIPKSFNALIGEDSTYAFNFGIDGFFPPQTFSVLENLLEQDTTIDYLFFELNSFHYLPEHYFIPTHYKYNYKFRELWRSYQYLFYGNFSLKVKLGMTVKYLIAYLENGFKIGMRDELIKFINGKHIYGYSFLGKNRDGYYPLTGAHTKNKEMKKRLSAYTDNLTKAFTKVYQNIATIEQIPYNPYFRNLLLEHLALAKSKNVELIFLLNPVKCGFHEVDDMVAMFHSLPATNRIDLANPIDHPELYEFENRWDEGHLNDKGARIYTQKLATAFNKFK